MKNSIVVSLTAVVLVLACSSKDDPSPNPGTSGDLTITSVVPLVRYADDVLTVVGTGFSTIKTENFVEMGQYSSGVFTPIETTSSGTPAFEVLSASTTQLEVKAVDAEYINRKVAPTYPYALRVTVNMKQAIGALGDFKELPKFNMFRADVFNLKQGCQNLIQAGDSLFISGVSFYGDCIFTIDGKPITIAKQEEGKIHFRISKLHFGQLDNDCLVKEVAVSLTNGDGKNSTKMYNIATSPPMIVNQTSFDKEVYSGESFARLTIKGYSIYSTAMLRLSGPNDYEAESNVGVQFYPDEAHVDFLLTGLAKGVYNLQVKRRQTDSYGFSTASFTLQ